MARKAKRSVRFMLITTGLILLAVLIMQPLEILHFQDYIAVLFPEGHIAVEQRNLLLILQALMLLVIVPVYILTFIFSWIYRSSNQNAPYDPDLVDNARAEIVWWGFPLVITLIISVITWYKTHELDPFKPIASDKKPVNVQVVALQWKWLFIYPEEQIATVNFLQIPVDTPVSFEITADAPMNAFWIPELGGMIYAMPAMKTKLNLIANSLGDFRGSSASLSGEGFSGMHFVTRSSTEEEYKKWIETAKKSQEALTESSYKQLALPSQNNPAALFRLEDTKLFDQIIMKYMHPTKH